MQKHTLKDELVTRGLWGEFRRTRAEVSVAGFRGREADVETLVRMGMDRTLERFVKDRRHPENRFDAEDIGNDERIKDALPDRPLDPLREDGEKAGGKGKSASKPAPKARRVSDSAAAIGFVSGLVIDGKMTWDVPKEVWRGRRCAKARSSEWVIENAHTRIPDDEAANALLRDCPSQVAWSILAEAKRSDKFLQSMMISMIKEWEKSQDQGASHEDDFDGREQYDLVASMRKTGVIE